MIDPIGGDRQRRLIYEVKMDCAKQDLILYEDSNMIQSKCILVNDTSVSTDNENSCNCKRIDFVHTHMHPDVTYVSSHQQGLCPAVTACFMVIREKFRDPMKTKTSH